MNNVFSSRVFTFSSGCWDKNMVNLRILTVLVQNFNVCFCRLIYRCACLIVPKMKKQRGKDSYQKLRRKVNSLNTFTNVDCHRDVHDKMALLKQSKILSKSKETRAAKQVVETKDLPKASVKTCQPPPAAAQSSVSESKSYPTHSDAEQLCDELPLPPPGTALIHPFCSFCMSDAYLSLCDLFILP